MSKAGNFLALAITSAAIGAVAGVLLAPDEGSMTRKKLMKKGKKLAGQVNDHIDDGMETLEDMRDVLQKQLNRVNKKIEDFA
jgi:gas vesicle protein